MNFNIEELSMLLEGLTKLAGNVTNWGLQFKIHNEIELEKNDNRICNWNDELTGFKELDNPGCP